MDRYYDWLAQTPLFEGIAPKELPEALSCLQAERKFYHRDQRIFWQGDPASRVGMVVVGAVQVVQEDWLGNRTILAQLGEAEIFGEAFACGGAKRLPVSVVATEDSEVWLLDYERLRYHCPNSCPYHTRIIANMLSLVAEKSLHLSQRVLHLSRRSTREKLMSYLNEQAEDAGSARFTIPFNRQELADYLGVERSALSAEISRMARAGILRTKRSEFELL